MEPPPSPSRAPMPSSVPTDRDDDLLDFLHVPCPSINGDGDGEEEDSVGMRRRRGGDDGVMSEESGVMVKRARVGGSGEGGGGVRVDADVSVATITSAVNVNGNEGFCFDFDLNEPVDYLGVGDSIRGFLDDAGGGEGLSAADHFESKWKQVLCIDLDGDKHDVQILDEGKFYASREESAFKTDFGTELKLGMIEVGSLGEGSSSSSCIRTRRRYTREEKGKGVLDVNWLSIAVENHRMAHSETERDATDGSGGGDVCTRNNADWIDVIGVADEPSEDCCIASDVNGIHLGEPEEFSIQEAIDSWLLPPQLNLEPPINDKKPPVVVVDLESDALLTARRQANRRREERRRNKEIAKDYASHLAHPQQPSAAESPRHEIQEITGPFSMAMQKILDHKQGKHWLRTQQRSFSIDWTPSRRQGSKLITTNIPSLLDLSLDVLAKNTESIVSLQPIPDALKRRISQAACDRRKMDSHLLEMLVAESPTEVYVKDCSWMTEEQFTHTFRSSNTKNLMVLQLDLCGQALTEHTLRRTLAQSENSLPALANLSLKSACRLTDNGLALIVESARLLQSINLSQCSLLTSCGISNLASCLGSTLKELYIDDCQNIDALYMLPALLKFERLEVLSVSGIHSVSDEFVRQFVSSRGSKLKEIGLAGCQKLTDSSLKAIGNACPGLCALNISNLDQLTDATVEYIANGCRSIQRLEFCRNSFSDEAIASFLEVSGQSLKELSLNHISTVGSYTALSLAKHSRNLRHLDLSWCRKLSDAAVGLIVDSCLSLKLLKLFGCTQITEVFLNGHSNLNVEIIGLNNMPVLKQLNAVDTHPGPLRYSPIITSELT